MTGVEYILAITRVNGVLLYSVEEERVEDPALWVRPYMPSPFPRCGHLVTLPDSKGRAGPLGGDFFLWLVRV